MGFLRLGIFIACGLAFAVHAEGLFVSTAIKTGQGVAGLQVDASRRSRLVTVNPGEKLGQDNWTPSSTIDFNLFDDARLMGEIERVSGPGEGRSILRGHIKDIAGSYFLLACESNVIAGTIFAPGKGA